jgi:hypothetical protein
MEQQLLTLFLEVRESFGEVKERVSLIKPYFELLCFSTGWALKIEEFQKLLGFKPEFIYESSEKAYAICVLYRIDDEVTTGIIAHEFAEIVARENNISDHVLIDEICVERGYGQDLLNALQNYILPGMVERDFIVRDDLEKRVDHLKKLLGVN